MSYSTNKCKIGDMLIESGHLTSEQLQLALDDQKNNGGRIGDVLIRLGLMTEEEFYRNLANQLHMPFLDMSQFTINVEVSTKIPEKLARRYKILLISHSDAVSVVAMSDPHNIEAYDAACKILNTKVLISVAQESELLKTINRVYRRTDDIASFAEELKVELQDGNVVHEDIGEVGQDDSPVAKLLDSILEDAAQTGASDIHLEPEENILRIRQRIDGVLQENVLKGTDVTSALVLRIKLIAKMNISEKRVPQDGRFNISIKGKKIDVRVSTMPVRFGESVVMRLLDQSSNTLKMNELGMPEDMLRRLEYIIHRPNGMLLVTGPTGSGKTTTLYSALSELNSVSKKIITIEDPIEYTLPRINQVQVNSKIHLTFANVLRACLRQDPDVVMVGEMRDEETAQVGIRAAMTGHFVLSTMHTNDSISSATRLLDMGTEGYLVSNALKGILAQRLVRKICNSCKKEATITPQQKSWLQVIFGKIDKDWKFMEGRGCSLCNNIGYSGRIGVYELLEINENLAGFLRDNEQRKFVESVKSSKNFKSLTQFTFDYVLKGITTVEELLRIASEIEDATEEVLEKEFDEIIHSDDKNLSQDSDFELEE